MYSSGLAVNISHCK